MSGPLDDVDVHPLIADEQAATILRLEAEVERLTYTVELLRPEEAERFWHLYRTHPYAKGEAL